MGYAVAAYFLFYCAVFVAWKVEDYYIRTHIPVVIANKKANESLSSAVKLGNWKEVVLVLGTPLRHVYDGGPKPRINAANAAADQLLVGGPRAAAAVVQFGLNNDGPQVRFMSMRVLGRIGHEEYAPAILEALQKENQRSPTPDACVLVFGAESLCLLGMRQEAKPILRRVYSLAEPEEFVFLQDRPVASSTHDLVRRLDARFNLHLFANPNQQ